MLQGPWRHVGKHAEDVCRKHFFAPPRDNELAPLKGAIEQRDMIMLYGPRQCGKTTLLQTLARSCQDTGQCVLYITLQRAVDDLSAAGCLHVNRLLAAAAGCADGGGLDLNNALWLEMAVQRGVVPSPPVLIIDEFDLLHKVTAKTRDSILHALRGLVSPAFESRVIRGIFLCGPYEITTLSVTPGSGAPFNIRVKLRGPASPLVGRDSQTPPLLCCNGFLTW